MAKGKTQTNERKCTDFTSRFESVTLGYYWLPVEIWHRILLEAVGTEDLVLYKHLKTVSTMFRDVAEGIAQPQPKLHISPCDGYKLKITPLASQCIVSYPWLLETTGIRSGVALALHSLFRGCLRHNSVLILEHFMLGWYRITDILYCSPNTLNTECELPAFTFCNDERTCTCIRIAYLSNTWHWE